MSSSQKIERVPVYKLMKVNVTKRISGQNIGQSDGQHWRGNMWMAFANTSDCIIYHHPKIMYKFQVNSCLPTSLEQFCTEILKSLPVTLIFLVCDFNKYLKPMFS